MNGTIKKIEPGVGSWRFWLLWVVATGLSSAIGSVVIVGAITYGYDLDRFQFIYYIGVAVLAIVVLGLLPGGVQWPVLRRYLARIAGWILATAGGFILTLFLACLSYIVSSLVVEINENLLDMGFILAVLMVINGLIYGIVTGTFQWLVLRASVPRATRWIVASVTGWGVGLFIGSVTAILYLILNLIYLGSEIILYGYTRHEEIYLSWTFAIVGVLMGIFSPLITGTAMVRLL